MRPDTFPAYVLREPWAKLGTAEAERGHRGEVSARELSGTQI